MELDFHGLITSDVALFSTCGLLENRVLKTRFIIQKNFKNLPSLKHSLTLPDRIRSERESDQSEGDQIRERERVRSERERKRSHDLGCATQAAWPRCACAPGLRKQAMRPGSRDPGARHFFFFVLFFIYLFIYLFIFSFWL